MAGCACIIAVLWVATGPGPYMEEHCVMLAWGFVLILISTAATISAPAVLFNSLLFPLVFLTAYTATSLRISLKYGYDLLKLESILFGLIIALCACVVLAPLNYISYRVWRYLRSEAR